MSLDDYHLPHEYKPPFYFDMSCDEYIMIFNKLISAASYAFNYFEKVAPKSFRNSYMYKRSGVFSIFGYFQIQRGIKYSRLVSVDFKPKDLRINPS